MKKTFTVFTKSAIFLRFNLEGFGQFFKPNNSKSGHGKSKLLLLSCREYLTLGTGFKFFHLKDTEPTGPKLFSVCFIGAMVCVSLSTFFEGFGRCRTKLMRRENGTKLKQKKKMTLTSIYFLRQQGPIKFVLAFAS